MPFYRPLRSANNILESHVEGRARRGERMELGEGRLGEGPWVHRGIKETQEGGARVERKQGQILVGARARDRRLCLNRLLPGQEGEL